MNRIIMSCFIAALSFGMSLYSHEKKNNGDIYGHTLANTFQKIDVTYSTLLCLDVSDYPCAYIELPEGLGIVTESFNINQAQNWVTLGYLEPLGTGVFMAP